MILWGPEVDRIDLKASAAAELIKAMGGGDVSILFHENGRVTVVAGIEGNRKEAQAEAERLLAHLQRRYRIVPD